MDVFKATIFSMDGKEGYAAMEGDVFELLAIKLGEFFYQHLVLDTSASIGAILNGTKIPRDSLEALDKSDLFFGKLSVVS